MNLSAVLPVLGEERRQVVTVLLRFLIAHALMLDSFSDDEGRLDEIYCALYTHIDSLLELADGTKVDEWIAAQSIQRGPYDCVKCTIDKDNELLMQTKRGRPLHLFNLLRPDLFIRFVGPRLTDHLEIPYVASIAVANTYAKLLYQVYENKLAITTESLKFYANFFTSQKL